MALSQSFFARSLACAIAATSVTALANDADAANLANYSTSSWNGKSSDLGNFGAGYAASFTSDLTNGALTGEASASSSIQLFGLTVSIAELKAAANINDGSSEGGSLTVKAVGTTIYNPSFTVDFNYSTPDYCTSFFDVSTTMTLGIVPITMFASAEGCAGITASATPQYNTTTHEGTLNLVTTPAVDVDLTVGAGVGSRTFSAGVEADVTLLDASFPITVAPTYNFSTTNLSMTTTGEVNLDMLSGSFNVYASVDLGFWDKKFSRSIFDWEGVTKDWILWATGEPSATNLGTSFTGQKVVGSYTYTDTANLAQSGSTHKWYRNSTASDTGRAEIYSSTTYADHVLVDLDSEKYLQYCVIPQNSKGTTGDEQCSDWTSVGKMAILYPHSNYGTFTGGAHVALAYEKVASNLCFNMSSMYWDSTLGYPFDNAMTSYKLYAPTGQQATFKFYQNANCSSSTSTDYASKVVSAGSSNLQTNPNDLGPYWNDQLSSFKVVYIDEAVEALDLSVTISGNKATGKYMFQVSDNAISTDESGSTYQWYRAWDGSGNGSTLISYSTTVQHTLYATDDQSFLKFCVTPSNGTTMGDQACSGWTSVGHVLKMYETNYEQGQHVAVAWEKSVRETCFNMSDYSFDNKMSAYNWYNNAIANTTIWFYKDANCTGTVATRTATTGGSEYIPNISSAMGSGWNDSISSFKVSWNSSIDIGTPTLTISANKVTESHTYSGGLGYPESGTTYTWYRAESSAGANSMEIANFNQNTYELTEDDTQAYLMVCVVGANAMMVDDATMCSSWTYVGPLVRFWADSSGTGVQLNFAYERTASGTCFNMTPYGFNNLISQTYMVPPTAPRPATLQLFKNNWCAGPYMSTPAIQTTSLYQTSFDDSISSVRVIY